MPTFLEVNSSDWVPAHLRGWSSTYYIDNTDGGPAVEYSQAASPTTAQGSIPNGGATEFSGTYLWLRGAGAVVIQSPADWEAKNTNTYPVYAAPSGTVFYVGGEAVALPGGVQVPSDWTAVAGVARILNKPTLLDAEAVQDLVAAMFAGSHTNLTATYNDATGTLTLAVSGTGGGGTTAEEVQDFLNTALVHANHTGVTVSYDDANNRFVFTAAGGGGAANLSLTTSATNVTVVSDVGTDAVIPSATTSTAGVMSSADKTKLNGIASGATANASDAQLRDRSTHTGAQAISTVTGLQTALDSKQASLMSGSNIKTINGTSLLGGGDVVITGVGGGYGINANDVGYDLVLVVGQSNAVGGGSGTADPYLDPVDPRVWRYVASTSTNAALATYKGKISLAYDPLGHPFGGGGVGPAMEFARNYVRIVPSNRRVLLVPAARGGASLVDGTPAISWDTTYSNGLFTLCVAQAKAALAAAGPNSRVTAILFVQGEAEAQGFMGNAAYSTHFSTLIAALKAQIPNSADAAVVIGSMVQSWVRPYQNWRPIASSHELVSSRMDKASYALGPYGTGDVHYTAAEAKVLGYRMFDAYVTARDWARVSSVPNKVKWLTLTADSAVSAAFIWSAPNAFPALIDYTVEYKPSSGSVWTSLPVVTAPVAEITGLTANTSYDVRVKARNSVGFGDVSDVLTFVAAASGGGETGGGGGTGGSSVQSLFDHTVVPSPGGSGKVANGTFGSVITASASGTVPAVWFYAPASSIGQSVTVGVFPGVAVTTPSATGTTTITAGGWNRVALVSPVSITSGNTFVVAYNIASGDYFSNTSQSYPFTPSGTSLTAPAGSCKYVAGTTFALPTGVYGTGTFFADVEFVPA